MTKNEINVCTTSDQGDNRPLSRAGSGRFKKGQSGNPGGRPRRAEEIREVCQSYSIEAVNVLVAIMRKGRPLERIAAARVILERGYGKPPQALQVESEAREPLSVILKLHEPRS